jgi:hypothetical protein
VPGNTVTVTTPGKTKVIVHNHTKVIVHARHMKPKTGFSFTK